MFPDRGWTFNESDISGIINWCSGWGRPQNAHPTAKITKVKDLALILWSVSLPNQNFIICQKTFWASVFLRNFFHLHPINEMFIVNGKSHCFNDIFTDVRFTSLLTRRIQIIFMLLESAFHLLFCLTFSFIIFFGNRPRSLAYQVV